MVHPSSPGVWGFHTWCWSLAGINAEDLTSIFEEHTIIGQVDPFNPIDCSFATRERVFNFGAVSAQLGGAPAVDSGASGTGAAVGIGEVARPGSPPKTPGEGGAALWLHCMGRAAVAARWLILLCLG